MLEDKYDREVFKKYRNKLLEITDHYEDCSYFDRPIPIDECMCNCYQKQIFKMGREAERDLFYGGDPRRK